MAIDVQGPGEGTVLEVKRARLRRHHRHGRVRRRGAQRRPAIVVGGQDEPIVTEIRALLQPRPLEEIRTEKKFEKVAEVGAAAG